MEEPGMVDQSGMLTTLPSPADRERFQFVALDEGSAGAKQRAGRGAGPRLIIRDSHGSARRLLAGTARPLLPLHAASLISERATWHFWRRWCTVACAEGEFCAGWICGQGTER